MRKLKTSDIPALCRTLKKLGLQEKLRAIAQEANTAAEAWDRGFDLVWNIFDVATEVSGEQHLYAFLAGPFEMTAAEVADLELDVFFSNLQQLAAENNLPAFFTSAARLMR